MAGCATDTADHLTSMSHRYSLQIPLHGMSSVKSKQVIISVKKIKLCGHHLVHINLLTALIADIDASCNDIQLRKHTVKKHGFHAGNRILQYDLKSLCLIIVCINSRKTRKAVFAVTDGITPVTHITAHASVTVFQHQGCTAEISVSIAGKFLWKRVHGIGSVCSRIIRISGKASVVIGQKIIHASLCLFAIVEMKKKSVLIHLHLICGLFCL